MPCDQCHEREAVIHLTQIVNEQVTTLHLCERCAAEKGVESPASAAEDPARQLPRGHGEGRRAAAGARGPATPAPRCGATLQDFRETGRLGCPDCYRTFEAPLRDLLRRLHGSTHHLGERYARARAGRGRRGERRRGAAGAAPPRGRDRELRAGRRAARPAAGDGMIDLSLLPDGGVGWLDASGPASHLVLSTRIRLARNLADHVFQGRNSRDASGEEILDAGRAGRAGVRRCSARATRFRLDQLDRIDRQLLHERHLVSKELAGLDADGRVRSGAVGADPGPARRHAERGGPPPAPGAPFRVRAGGGLRRGRPAGRRTGTTTCFRISPRVRLSYRLSDERRDRAAGVGADPPAGLVLTKEIGKVLQGCAGGADLPRAVRRGERGRRQLLPDLEPDDARAARSDELLDHLGKWCGR